jgi:hypothetical protein
MILYFKFEKNELLVHGKNICMMEYMKLILFGGCDDLTIWQIKIG